MAELRVTRADLTAQARMNKEGGEISLSDLDRQRSAVRDIEDVTFVDDDGTEYPIKGEGPVGADLGHDSDLDYLDRKEENANTDEERREGVLGSELQHRNTTGGEGGDLTTDEANLKDTPLSSGDVPGAGPNIIGEPDGTNRVEPTDTEEQTASGEAPEEQQLKDEQAEQPTDQEQAPQS